MNFRVVSLKTLVLEITVKDHEDQSHCNVTSETVDSWLCPISCQVSQIGDVVNSDPHTEEFMLKSAFLKIVKCAFRCV